jgi:hypothetical protein
MESGKAVNKNFAKLADERRLQDAVHQLREQESLVPIIDNECNRGMLLSLLSSAVRQFYFLQRYRKVVLKSLGL